MAVGRQAHHGAGRGGGPRHRDLAVGVEQPLEGDRRDQERHRYLGAEDGRRRAHLADIDQNARAQRAPGVRGDVVAQRPLVAGAAGEVAVDAGLEPIGRPALVLRRR